MKNNNNTDSGGSQAFLTGAILFANFDYSGLGSYAIKAIIGGAIWTAFKLFGDYVSEKYFTNKNKNKGGNDTSSQFRKNLDN